MKRKCVLVDKEELRQMTRCLSFLDYQAHALPGQTYEDYLLRFVTEEEADNHFLPTSDELESRAADQFYMVLTEPVVVFKEQYEF